MYIYISYYYDLSQTLTILDLANNSIDQEGVHYLINILQKNTVRTGLYSFR